MLLKNIVCLPPAGLPPGLRCLVGSSGICSAAFADDDCGLAATPPAAVAPPDADIGVPHAPQNLNPGGIGALHAAQLIPAAACCAVPVPGPTAGGARKAACPAGSNEIAALQRLQLKESIGFKVLQLSQTRPASILQAV